MKVDVDRGEQISTFRYMWERERDACLHFETMTWDCWAGNKLIFQPLSGCVGVISGLKTSGAQFGWRRPVIRSCIQHSMMSSRSVGRERKKEKKKSCWQDEKDSKPTEAKRLAWWSMGRRGVKEEKVVWRVLPSIHPHIAITEKERHKSRPKFLPFLHLGHVENK